MGLNEALIACILSANANKGAAGTNKVQEAVVKVQSHLQQSCQMSTGSAIGCGAVDMASGCFGKI